jgi:hypothetical protein
MQVRNSIGFVMTETERANQVRWNLRARQPFAGGATYEEQTMKLSTIALAGGLALTSTFALAQSSTSSGSMGAGSNMNGPARTPGSGENPAGASGMKASGSMERGTSSGSAITTGSGVPQDKPNLSGSPESSDTSQKVK